MVQFLDPDKTHDILWVDKVSPVVQILLAQALGSRGVFDGGSLPIIFVDRDAPGGMYPWAENWSFRLFKFLKKLSRTHILHDGFLNGSAWGFDPPYSASLNSIDLSNYKLDWLSIRIPPQSEGVLTWLEQAHDVIAAPYCSNLTNRIACVMRRQQKFKNDTDLPKLLTFSTENWLHNSVCFEGIELIDIDGERAKFLLYDEMNSFLDYLLYSLDIPDNCQVLTQMLVTVESSFRIAERDRVFPFWAYQENFVGNKFDDSWLLNREISYSSPIFLNVPEDYCYAGAIIAGINYGIPTTTIFKDGSLEIGIGYTRDFFDNWREFAPLPEWYVNFPSANGFFDPSIEDEFAFQMFYPLAWGGSPTIGTRHLFDPVELPESFAYPYPDLIPPIPLYDWFGANNSQNPGGVFRLPMWTKIGEAEPYLKRQVTWSNGNSAFKTDMSYWGMTFPVRDKVLFKNSNSVFFHQQIAMEYIYEEDPLHPGDPYITRKEVQVLHAFNIKTTFDENLSLRPVFEIEQGINAATVIFESSGGLWSGTHYNPWTDGGLEDGDLYISQGDYDNANLGVNIVNMQASFFVERSFW